MWVDEESGIGFDFGGDGRAEWTSGDEGVRYYVSRNVREASVGS